MTTAKETVHPDIREAAAILNQDKAENLVILNLENVHSYLSYFLIGTALSRTHLKKLTQDAIVYLKSRHHYLENLPEEIDFDSGWIIIDGGGFIIHLFMPETRAYYDLEGLWKDAKRESL